LVLTVRRVTLGAQFNLVELTLESGVPNSFQLGEIRKEWTEFTPKPRIKKTTAHLGTDEQ
jgi:hypothetical protein